MHVVDDRVPGRGASYKQLADMEADPKMYFRHAREEAARRAAQQVEAERQRSERDESALKAQQQRGRHVASR